VDFDGRRDHDGVDVAPLKHFRRIFGGRQPESGRDAQPLRSRVRHGNHLCAFEGGNDFGVATADRPKPNDADAETIPFHESRGGGIVQSSTAAQKVKQHDACRHAQVEGVG